MIFGRKKKAPTPGSLAERIEARLQELGKNPSSVAIEAGLGRSSVRDIINNDANPRVDTLRKLTGPLECSLEYLMGTSPKPGKRPTYLSQLVKQKKSERLQRSGLVRTGVFRPYPTNHRDDAVLVDPLVGSHFDPPGYSYQMEVVGDTSLRDLCIEQGDVLIIARRSFGHTPINAGDIVSAGLIIGESNKLEERAIRTVETVGADTVLRSYGPQNEFTELRLVEDETFDEPAANEEASGLPNVLTAYHTTIGHKVTIYGIMTRVIRSRDLPTYEIPHNSVDV